MGFLRNVGQWFVTPSASYDAVASNNKRKAADGICQSEDRELKPQERKKLISAARDITRNYTIAAWMLRKHLDYVTSFTFASRTGNDDLDERIEALMAWRSRKANFDVAARHPLPRMLRLLEARRVLDGDVGILKLKDGRVQAIEGDRIQAPSCSLPEIVNPSEFTHGVQLGVSGDARAYSICKRNGTGFLFERIVPSYAMYLHAYWDRIDQCRGISPMAPAINTLRDTYEGLDYALVKMKVAQLFAMVFYRDAADELATHTATEDGDGDGTADSKYTVDFGRGPVKLELDAGDRAEFLESKTPALETQSFCNMMIGIALKALDIPVTFNDVGEASWSGGKLEQTQYNSSCEVKRSENRELLDNLTGWWLSQWIADGILVLPAGMTVADLKWEWVAAGIPWLDELKETQAAILQEQHGYNSPQRIVKARTGQDYYTILREIAQAEQWKKELGIPSAQVQSTVIEVKDGNE